MLPILSDLKTQLRSAANGTQQGQCNEETSGDLETERGGGDGEEWEEEGGAV